MLLPWPRMDRLLARLERRFGRYAVPNLILYVVGGMALMWAVTFARPYAIERMVLDLDAVRRGEVWRLFTFLLIPSTTSPLWILFNLYFTWWVGSSLEENWGAFKFDIYYLVGILGTIAAAALAGPQSNTYLNGSLLLALAAVAPDVTVLLIIIPVRLKWLGLAVAVYLGYLGMRGDWSTRAAIIAAVSNYLLFFAGHWWGFWKGRNVAVRQRARARVPEQRVSATLFGQRVCAPLRRAKPTAWTSAFALARSAAGSSERCASSTRAITSSARQKSRRTSAAASRLGFAEAETRLFPGASPRTPKAAPAAFPSAATIGRTSAERH